MKKMVLVICVVGILLGTFITFSAGARSSSLADVRAKHERQLIAIKGVSGVSTDTATNQIVVYTETQKACANVPKELDGFTVRCEVIGRIEALQPTAAANPTDGSSLPGGSSGPPTVTYSRTGIDRPVFGGISVMTSAFPNAAGTLGLVTQDGQVLSCAHVLAMDANANFIGTGTAVWQPGGLDSGGVANPIGALTKSIPITFGASGTNYADAATASLSVAGNKGQVLNAANTGFITISGTTSALLGDSVSKSGRTSGVTTSQVTDPSATVVVYYTSTTYAIFTDQLLVRQPFISSGDSGSAVYKTVQGQAKFVGLGFAGSDTVGVVCKAQYITSGLGVNFGGTPTPTPTPTPSPGKPPSSLG